MSAQIRGLSAPSAGKFREDKALRKKLPPQTVCRREKRRVLCFAKQTEFG